MNNKPISYPTSLEEIAQKKAELLQQIRIRKKNMRDLAGNIFAPLSPVSTKANSLTKAFNTGMAVFNGIMTGWKFIRQFKNFFSKKRK